MRVNAPVKSELYRPFKVDSVGTGDQKKVSITAEDAELKALAVRFGVQSVDSLTADLIVDGQSDGCTYCVSGTLKAQVTQPCVVTLEDLHQDIEEEVEAWFYEEGNVASYSKNKKIKEMKNASAEGKEMPMPEERDDPEVIENGIIDLGDVVAQFMALGIDLYPSSDKLEDGQDEYVSRFQNKEESPFSVLKDIHIKTQE